jgi:hypothetical protein
LESGYRSIHMESRSPSLSTSAILNTLVGLIVHMYHCRGENGCLGILAPYWPKWFKRVLLSSSKLTLFLVVPEHSSLGNPRVSTFVLWRSGGSILFWNYFSYPSMLSRSRNSWMVRC